MLTPLLSPALHEYAHRCHQDRITALGGRTIPADAMLPDLDADRRALMELMIGTLPLADILDRSPETLLGYADHALMLRRTRPWTATLPEDVFIHYVFWPRINNERLEPCRPAIASELDARITGMDMERAVVETNYWCAEHVTYAPTDGRTLSPMGALNRGIGRCGEESTLLVTALRAIGVPARQVYTPRWAHCDDNHAWVEAMVDGVWRFMGACEPEERLDRGWFDRASARAMLVHARVFCDYSTGTVDVGASAGEQDDALLENLTDAYAPITRLSVTVTHPDGTPAADAAVSFELLNMAEFTPIARLRTDAQGRAELQVGRGSLLVHASTADLFGQTLVDTAATDQATVVLGAPLHPGQDPDPRLPEDWTALTLHAPAAGESRSAALSDEERATGTQRALQAEAMRVARLDGFAAQSARGHAAVDALLRHAGGNWPTLARFLDQDDDPDRLALLQALADKDLCDTGYDVLEDTLQAAARIRDHAMSGPLARLDGERTAELWRDCVLNPRVLNEELTADHRLLQDLVDTDLTARFRRDPAQLWARLNDGVRDVDDDAPCASASALWISGLGDAAHRRIAFVAICRVLGIPARLDPEGFRPQYFDGSRFVTVQSGAATDVQAPVAAMAPCTITAEGREDVPRYQVDWSLGQLQRTPRGMDYVSLDLSELPWDGDGMRVMLEPGDYRAITTVRLPNGNQMAAVHGFTVTPDGCALRLRWRTPDEDDLLERLPLENLPFTAPDGTATPLDAMVGDRRAVLFILDANGSEPSIHVLDELREFLTEHADTEVEPILALSPAQTPASDPIMRMMDRLPRPFELWRCDEATASRLARITFVDPDKMPLIIAVHPAADGGPTTGVYACSGYNVGSVALAMRLNRLTGSRS